MEKKIYIDEWCAIACISKPHSINDVTFWRLSVCVFACLFLSTEPIQMDVSRFSLCIFLLSMVLLFYCNYILSVVGGSWALSMPINNAKVKFLSKVHLRLHISGVCACVCFSAFIFGCHETNECQLPKMRRMGLMALPASCHSSEKCCQKIRHDRTTMINDWNHTIIIMLWVVFIWSVAVSNILRWMEYAIFVFFSSLVGSETKQTEWEMNRDRERKR